MDMTILEYLGFTKAEIYEIIEAAQEKKIKPREYVREAVLEQLPR